MMQTEEATIGPDIRKRLLETPDVILEDADLMRALIEADGAPKRGNIVDLRGVAMDRLESRLSRLEKTHNTVIAAAYDNLSGTQQVHRAVLALFEHDDFEAFLHGLGTQVNDLLHVSTTRLVLESADGKANPSLDRVGEVVRVVDQGFVQRYMSPREADQRVILRQVPLGETALYGPKSDWVASEACIQVDLGEGRFPAMLALASDDPRHFMPGQATDLLDFFGSVLGRVMRRWLG